MAVLVRSNPPTGAPNQLWVADLTYVPTWSGMVYVAFVFDVYSRMIVGWRAATRMTTVLDTMEMAVWNPDPAEAVRRWRGCGAGGGAGGRAQVDGAGADSPLPECGRGSGPASAGGRRRCVRGGDVAATNCPGMSGGGGHW